MLYAYSMCIDTPQTHATIPYLLETKPYHLDTAPRFMQAWTYNWNTKLITKETFQRHFHIQIR